MHLVGGTAIELEIARQHGDVTPGGGHRFAGVARFQPGQFFVVRQHALAQAQQQPPALQRGHPAPVAVQRVSRRLHGHIHVGLLAARNGGEHLAVHRRYHLDRAPVAGIGLTAADNHLRHGKSPWEFSSA
ncbi:hypothetical protein D3C72_2124160 [compost metagenome]